MSTPLKMMIVGGLFLLLLGGSFWALQGRGTAAPRQTGPIAPRSDGAAAPAPPPAARPASVAGTADAASESTDAVEAEAPERTEVPAPVRPADSEKERWFVEHLDEYLDAAETDRLLQGRRLMLSDADWDEIVDLTATLQDKLNQAWVHSATLSHQVGNERLARGEGELVTDENRAELLRPAYPGESILQRTSEKGLIVIRVPPGVDRRLDEPRRLVEEMTELKKRSVIEFLESRLKKGR